MNMAVQTVAERPPLAPAPAPAERFHALDALRAVAMLLGIYLHAAVPYMASRPPFWPAHLNDAYQSLIHDVGIFIIHAFRMELFFVMAGFFAHLLLNRRGTRAFVRHRGVRIGIPLLAGWGLMTILLPLSVGWRPFTDPRFLLPAHLWFLYYLLVFYALAVVIGHFVPSAAGMPERPGRAEAVFASVMRSPLQIPALSLLTFPALLTMKTPVVDTPLAFYPIPRVAAYYGLFFAVGWLLHRQRGLLDTIQRRRWISLAACILLTLPLLILLERVIAESGGLVVGGVTPAVVALRIGYACYTWALLLAVTGFFLRHFNGQSRAMRYLADSAYWQYIMHLPLVLFLQWKMVAAPIPGPMKLVVILVLTSGTLLLSYHLFVRHTLIGRVLNGPRDPRNAMPTLFTRSGGAEARRT